MTLQDTARRYFAIDLPCTEAMLKSAFRSAAKRLHTDTGGDKDAFIAMKAAYDQLCESPSVVTDHVDTRARTFQGDLLSDLGLGLGMVNGKDCPQCDHKGYTVSQQLEFDTCPHCEGCGDVFFCQACRGTGQYTNPVGRKVPCRACHARGTRPAPRVGFWMPARGARACPKCLGTGRVGKPTQKFTYYRCGECNGTGEIKIYNPVLLKNGLMTQRQRKAIK